MHTIQKDNFDLGSFSILGSRFFLSLSLFLCLFFFVCVFFFYNFFCGADKWNDDLEIKKKLFHIEHWNIEFTQPWAERRKNCVQDTIKCISSTPAFQTPDELVLPRRSIASSSSLVTVTQPMSSTSTALKIKQRSRSHQRRLPLIHVKLAQENAPSEHSDSDSACYDSVNEMETGLYMFSLFLSIILRNVYQFSYSPSTNVNASKYSMNTKWCSHIQCPYPMDCYWNEVLAYVNYHNVSCLFEILHIVL